MTPRERTLAIAVGAIVVLLGAWFIQQGISSRFRDRRALIENLEGDIAKQRLEALQSAAASRKRNEYEARSLPSQSDLARSLYQRWLLEQVQEADIEKPLVSSVASRDEGGALTRHQFNISGRARLNELVKLLYALQRVDTLHRISRLSIRRVQESKDLDIQISMEALALKTAPVNGKLPLQPSPRLANTQLVDFLRPIEERNLFGPQNQPPQMAAASPTLVTNKSADFAVKASDPDPLDKVTYRLTKSTAADALLDAETGKLRWTPKKPGKYEFTVEAIDDGTPSKSTQRTFTVAVNDPPPPEPPKVEPKTLAFDAAKFTVLTAVLEVSGETEVWLLIRPQGKTLKLRTGDEFEIGSVKGEVVAIGQNDFSFKMDGELRSLGKGDTLDQAQIESTTATQAPVDAGTVN